MNTPVPSCPGHHPNLPPLFDPNLPDNPVLWSVLKGVHNGKAFVCLILFAFAAYGRWFLVL
jgi:hypothetical protein